MAVSNLGYQLIYALINRDDRIVCERFVYPESGSFRSLESSRPLRDFPLVFASVSFEADYPALAALLAAGGVEPFHRDRDPIVKPGAPLVVIGGAAMLVNPEPLAPFADLMVVGEAEPVLAALLDLLIESVGSRRSELCLAAACTLGSCYAPGWYDDEYDADGRLIGQVARGGVPARVRRVHSGDRGISGHSVLQSPEAELNMYMTELGRGCSRGCRFCAAGFIYRPPRLWSGDAVLDALNVRPQEQSHVGLLGMEMAETATLDRIAAYLEHHGCSLSFSSLRADRISARVLSLLTASGLKSVAIAPDGASQRLRQVINKGLDEEDLLNAGERLVGGGIVNLKLYVMIGLPTETTADLDELIAMVHRLQKRILPLGRRRGRVSEITLSVNSFVPKPWTPFQYAGFGGLGEEESLAASEATAAIHQLKDRIRHLRQGFAGTANLRIKTDHPERVLQQAVFSRGDRRLAPVLLDMGTGRRSFKQSMRRHGLSSAAYAVRHREEHEILCWERVDHGLRPGYLWEEYQRGLKGKTTAACDTTTCRRCGICNRK